MPGKKRKRYRLRPRFFVITGTALILLLSGILLLVRSCSGEPPVSPPESASSGSAQSSDTPSENNSRYLSEILFTGDSRTRGLVTYGFVPSRQVLAVDGLNHRDARKKELFDSEDGVQRTLAAVVGEREAKRVMISFGINGMDFISEEDYFTEYEALIDELMAQSPQSSYLLQAIYPVSSVFSEQNPNMSNETIDRYNQKLRELAEEKGIFFLNTAEALKDAGGALGEAYDAGDGLHMSREAYKVIVRYIREHPAP
ncbi:MAG: hypothetical protein HFG26_12290 [Provencibacterium sp.]|jgi:lysophospholipase L1-like esterase|nr:hypothetical protein [Provencibacterium sp.]